MYRFKVKIFKVPKSDNGGVPNPSVLNIDHIETSEGWYDYIIGEYLSDYVPGDNKNRCVYLLEDITVPWPHDKGAINDTLVILESAVGDSWRYCSRFIGKWPPASLDGYPEVVDYYTTSVVNTSRKYITYYDVFPELEQFGNDYIYGLVTEQGYYLSSFYLWNSNRQIVSMLNGDGGIIDGKYVNENLNNVYYRVIEPSLTSYPYYSSAWYCYVSSASNVAQNFASAGGYNATQSKTNYFNWIKNEGEKVTAEELGDTTDPYAQAGQSGPGGGIGNVDNTSDPVDFPDLPTISATDTGLVTLFNPTQAQLKALADYMWTDSAFDVDNFKKIFADPMDCILGLSILPINIHTTTTKTVSVGNMSTGISMNFVSDQYVQVDCGTLNINEYWGAYIDYAPYTKCEIYLPFIGFRPLDTDVIMNKPLHVKYHVDLLSGTCVAYIKAGESVVYSYIGQCSIEIPVTGNSYGNMLQGVLGIAGSVGSLVATGGASAPSAISNIASTVVDVVKPEIQKSGAYSGGGALLGIQKPYLVITRPRQAVPANQNKYLGYPSFITKTIANLTGYTEMEQLRLHDLGATEAETEEIRRILEGGVIL